MVRIRDDVEFPMHGWGSVSRGDCGRVPLRDLSGSL